MGALLNAKHELACQNMAAGMNQTEAWHKAGHKRAPVSASKFFARPEAAARVRELIAQRFEDDNAARKIAVEKRGLTESWVIERLMYLTEVSLRGQPVLDASGVQIPGQFSGRRDGTTAARCLELAARIKGMLVNRHEVGEPGAFANVTDDKIDEEMNRLAKELGFTKMPKGVRGAMN